MSTTDAPGSAERPAAVAVRDVDKELREQVNALQQEDGTPLVWARMSNLLVVCDRDETAERVTKDIPQVLSLHPARVLLLVASAAGDGAASAAVRVWSHQGERGQRIASEQVTLRASGPATRHLPFAVRGLLIGDLPTNLWWATAQPPALAGALLDDLAECVQQLVYDSIGWTEPAKAVAATDAWLARFERPPGTCAWRIASDLNWRRLKYWRRLIGQALDPGSAPGAMETMTEVLVEHGPHAVVQAWELVSWLAARLGWRVQAGRMQPNVEIGWNATARHGPNRLRIHRLGEGPSELRRVRIACSLDGTPAALDIVVEDGRRLAVTTQGVPSAPRTLTIQPQSAAELVARQLSDRQRDPVFRQSMAVARELAQGLLA